VVARGTFPFLRFFSSHIFNSLVRLCTGSETFFFGGAISVLLFGGAARANA
jgi:hypothetical protein